MKLLIVDDHARSRSNLIRLCERNDDVQVVGEAASGTAALDAAQKLDPDLLLLDVELPDMSGFELLRAVSADTRPLGIIVSKCNDHAVRALTEGAVDYLVTPVSAERFDRAIARARHRFDGALPWDGQPLSTSSVIVPMMRAAPRFLVGERRRRLYPLDPQTIDYIEADGNYVTLRVGNVEYLSRDSIKRLSSDLVDFGFMRIERSLLVNAAAVAYAEAAGHGTFALTLDCGVCLHSSAAYRDRVLRIIPFQALSKRHRRTTAQ